MPGVIAPRAPQQCANMVHAPAKGFGDRASGIKLFENPADTPGFLMARNLHLQG